MATITARGSYQWQAKVRRNGWPVQSATFDTKAEAEAWARDVENKMDRSVFVDRSKAERETLGEVIDDYLKRVTPKHKGHEPERMRLERFKREETKLCDYAMANLTPEHFESYRDRRLKDVAPGTVQRELNLLHSVIEHCRRRLNLFENVVSEVKRPKVRNERFSRLEDGEEAKLLAAFDTCRNPYVKPAVILALETGMRRGELLSLKWGDVDLAQQTAALRDTKNGHARDVPLSKRAVAELKKLQRKRDKDMEKNKVVPIDGSGNIRVLPVTANALKHAWERGRERAGMEHFNFHDLRHEAISRLFERGWDAVKVSAFSGHRSMQCLKRYANFRARDLAKELG